MRASLLILLVTVLIAGCASLPPEPVSDPQPVVTVLPHPAEDLSPTVTEPLPEPEAEILPDPEPSYDTVWERMLAGFALPSCENHESALRWADWYASKTQYMGRIFKRAEPWIYDIVNELERRNMPAEIALLPIVESAYDPFAYSKGRAMGTWQFIASTGKNYGLKQDWWYDGRRDVYASTRAAMDYLQYMADMFEGDWLLSLAGYNSGEGRVRRQVRRQKARGKPSDFWNLKLPRETRGYVPKLLGLQCLFKNSEAYGFEPPPIPNTPRVTMVDPGRQVDLVVAARMADISVAELFALNPGYNRWATAPHGPHRLILPLDAAASFLTNLSAAPDLALMRWDQVTVESGDTLGKLAAVHGVPVSVIRSSNNLRGDMIRVGQKLRLPREGSSNIDPLYATAAQELTALQARLVAPARSSHRIRPGESLSTIARRHRVSVADLQRWNGISNAHRIRAGQVLTLFQSPVAAPSKGRTSRYTVQQGDSLWLIARKHRVNLNDLLRWNNLSNNSVLMPGQSIKLTP